MNKSGFIMAGWHRLNAPKTIRNLLVLWCMGMFAMPGYAQSPSPPEGIVGAERQQLFAENPWLIRQLGIGGGFGNVFSSAIANQMYSRTNPAAIADARSKLKIEKYGERTWVLRFPIVNVAVFETDEGLVLVDSGYAPAGPVLLDVLKELSDKAVHTVILTHHHIDHALGAWALLEGENKPEIIATQEFLNQQQRDLDLAQYMTNRNHQAPATIPRGWLDVVKPSRVFTGSLSLEIGGERFELTQARAETADQLYVYVPGRNALVTADYYQRFIPNAGNGRRPMRYVAEWSDALAAMASLNAHLMIPMHGLVLTNQQEIKARLSAHTEILKSIDEQVKTALNAGTPEYLIAASVVLPKKHSQRDDVAELYVSVGDIAKMVLHQYTGWWDDLPSNWDSPALRQQAQEMIRLAGGVKPVLERIKTLQADDIRMASYLADQAWLAESENIDVLTAAYLVYLSRLKGAEPVQEALVYVDHLVRLRRSMNLLGVSASDLQNSNHGN